MNATTTTPQTPTAAARKPRVAMGLRLGPIGPEVRRQASAVLEVLSGVLSPTDVAKALSLSLPAYYKLEARAVRGLIEACRPPGRGPRPAPEKEAQKLRRQCRRLQQDLQRYQALARAAQRAAGMPAPPKPKPDARGRRKRKPAVRALKAIEALKRAPEAKGDLAPSATGPVASPSATVR
jgi:hypothetical protein